MITSIEGRIEVMHNKGGEYDEEGTRLLPRFNCAFHRSNGVTAFLALTAILEALDGLDVAVIIVQKEEAAEIEDCPSQHDDTDLAEMRDCGDK